jgi:hypothetical protein
MATLVLAAWLGFRLSEGPLTLSFLTPYFEDALRSPDGNMAVKLDTTVLVWSAETRTLEIRAEGVRALSGESVIASVPEMSVSLSGAALFRGVIAPRALRLLHPTIRLRRDLQGNLQYGLGLQPSQDNEADTEKSNVAIDEAFQALLTPPNSNSPAGLLERVEVVGGDLSVDDQLLGVQWHAPRADLRFLRNLYGISMHSRIDLQLAGEAARLDADGLYRMDSKTVEATLGYGGVRPSLLAEVVPQLAQLASLNLPTGGTVGLRWSAAQGVTEVSFDLVGGEGVLDLSSVAGVSWPVASVALRGALTDGLTKATLEEARIDLGGPVVTLNGHAEDITGALKLDATARADDMPVEQLKGLWPPAAAPNPRNWILANLSHGQVRQATAHLQAHVPPGKTIDDLAVDDMSGDVLPEGVDVQYLAPMPVVHNGVAVCHFDKNTFTIEVKNGELMGLKVLEGSKVVLGGLSSALQFADINVKISGPVADALRLIDSKPLGWASRLGVQPAKVKGDALTTLDLKFPLLQNLKFDQLKVHAQSVTTKVAIPEVALGLDLSEANLALDVDPNGLDVTGQALLGGLAAQIKWRENFSRGAPFRSRYQVQGVLDDAGRRVVGLGVAPFQAPFITGPVPVDVTAILNEGGRGDIDIAADLTQAGMTLPGLNWSKKAGVVGQATTAIKLVAGRLAEVPRFAVSSAADGLDVRGRVAFENGLPRLVAFERAHWGRTDVRGNMTIKPAGGGLGIDVNGPSFDARELIGGAPSGTEKKPIDRKAPREETVPLTVSAKIGQVWLTDDGAAKAMTLSMVRDPRDIRQLHVDGLVGEAKPMHMEIQPAPANRRNVRVTSTDAGAVFRAFSLYDNLIGGQLLVEAFYDDANPRQPLKGVATVTDYQVVKAPALARLLTVAALTGIVDLLAGDGISFSTLDAPFTLTDGVLMLNDARASGTALGITAKGQIDLDNDVMALEGTVVPAYVLNSAFGRLPVIGGLFAAEKGGGVFAMNYSMKGPSQDPSVMVNPLSALTPGFLRKLFNIFDDGSETAVRQGVEKPTASEPLPPVP